LPFAGPESAHTEILSSRSFASGRKVAESNLKNTLLSGMPHITASFVSMSIAKTVSVERSGSVEAALSCAAGDSDGSLLLHPLATARTTQARSNVAVVLMSDLYAMTMPVWRGDGAPRAKRRAPSGNAERALTPDPWRGEERLRGAGVALGQSEAHSLNLIEASR
jgi:hypothetical protein